MNIAARCWNAEPILVALLGSAAVWGGIFSLLAAFGHPLTDDQQHALVGLAIVLAGLLARSKVVAPDTHAQIISDIQKANTP